MKRGPVGRLHSRAGAVVLGRFPWPVRPGDPLAPKTIRPATAAGRSIVGGPAPAASRRVRAREGTDPFPGSGFRADVEFCEGEG